SWAAAAGHSASPAKWSWFPSRNGGCSCRYTNPGGTPSLNSGAIGAVEAVIDKYLSNSNIRWFLS
ncbi:hypothetical protein A2U01_0096464, partial [Trifolium medium]|nr:hypothetical protein [Trifolium medium]